MSAFAGVQGYETLSSAQQRERGFATGVDHGLASKPSAPPSHLSRVLYIPPLHNSQFHALVQDVSADYKHVISHSPLGESDIIGDAVMGSRLFMTRLGTMKKPATTMSDAESQYAIDAKVELTQALIKLEKVNPEDASRNVTICLPNATDDFKLTDDENLDVQVSFPIPDTTSSAGTARNPFFTFSSRDGSKKLQWQINPAESGPLRYTLIELDHITMQEHEDSKPEHVRAVYHHIGQSPSLSMCSGEGVLLLQPVYSKGHVTEEEILASLLGLLWRVRGMEIKPVAYDVCEGNKKSLLRRMLKG
ncbi:hypothetical protein JDV02_002845 [Purpureocillium takamizusanense]|uniref:Uncharacterized protein n=1 Tax=Purpureocillium takamizusanense TaxID=2060973 RepID=A0A9Q8QCG9_9HYPO|nr:uncharacterized protein JDV02_002845 [Purpureocillium takamizusanense]UNI16411.1 hypothetical protein JDV02_002845 [Purpureocillium takamizusanense]